MSSKRLASRHGSVFRLLNFIDMKVYSFTRIVALGNFWFTLADGFFPEHDEDHVLTAKEIENCHFILDDGRRQLQYVGLVQSAKYILNMKAKLRDKDVKNYGEYRNECSVLHDLVLNEIDGRVFGFLPEDHGKYFNQTALFGDAVNDRFQSAHEDIREAGNCFAHGSYSACVYHLMRVSEHGLRGLAASLKIKLKDKGKEMPVEYGTWDKVITACKNKITAIRQGSIGPKREAKLALYSDAADHCLFMKDIWRNNASHTRKLYSEPEAVAALERVRDFMKFLAANEL